MWACRLSPGLAFSAVAKAIVAQLRLIGYRLTLPPRPQTCKDCWHSGGLDFHVPDVLWRAVIDGQLWKVPGLGAVANPMLCLACFDRRAEHRGVDYRPGSGSIGMSAVSRLGLMDCNALACSGPQSLTSPVHRD